MKSILMLLLCTGFLNSAYADSFDGIWRGTGYVQAPDGSGHNDCTTAVFAVAQTPTTLTIKKGEFRCGAINSSWTPVSFVIQGNNLVVDGTNQIYGHIDETTFSFHFESGGVTWDANFELQNGVLSFHDQINYSSTEALITSATFTKSDSSN